MASGLNPIIAAFLQSREQASNDVARIKQNELFQQRLQAEQEAAQLEHQYRQGVLTNAQNKLQFEKDQAEQQLNLNTVKAQIDALGTVGTLIDKNLLQTPGIQKILKQAGLPEEMFKTFADVAQGKTAAKVSEQAALAPGEIDLAGGKAGAIAKAQEPFKIAEDERKSASALELEEIKDKNRTELKLQDQQFRRSLEAYKQSQANARAEKRNATVKNQGLQSTAARVIAESHDRNPTSKRISEASTAWEFIKDTPLNNTNPAEDLNMIVYSVKITDPGVSVRPMEFETVRKAVSGLSNDVRVAVERTMSSGGAVLLTPKARQELRQAAERAIVANARPYIRYRESIVDRLKTHTGSEGADDFIGAGFLPQEVQKVEGKWYWTTPRGAVPIFKEK